MLAGFDAILGAISAATETQDELDIHNDNLRALAAAYRFRTTPKPVSVPTGSHSNDSRRILRISPDVAVKLFVPYSVHHTRCGVGLKYERALVLSDNRVNFRCRGHRA